MKTIYVEKKSPAEKLNKNAPGAQFKYLKDAKRTEGKVFILTDADPHGWMEFKKAKKKNKKAVFLGLRGAHFEKFEKVTIKLSGYEKKTLRKMLRDPFFKGRNWQKQIKYLLSYGRKIELEGWMYSGLSAKRKTLLAVR
ncbi:MAG: hypothetical protein V1911_01720 [Candidatus Micrarchaeota archaeon]